MLTSADGILIPQCLGDLPDYTKAHRLYMDFETSNSHEDEREGGGYPWWGDQIGGIAVTADDDERIFYIPIRHVRSDLFVDGNLPSAPVLQWLHDTLHGVEEWWNHNILFDAAFAAYEADAIPPGDKLRLYDTLTLSKVHNSERMDYSLKTLLREWLEMDTQPETDLHNYLKAAKTKNYMRYPLDRMANYAGMDVRGNRLLAEYLRDRRPDDLSFIWEIETKLTSVLHDMEMEGLRVDVMETKKDQLITSHRLLKYADELAELTDREFTNSSQCIGDILFNQFGFPILATKKERDENGREYDTGRPTFDKYALPLYASHPIAQSREDAARVLELIGEYRAESQHKGLFVDSFLRLVDEDDHIHPSYNQVVRTGRMSCKRPNAQQQNKRSKRLIIPEEDEVFISNDYSQIEFRLIVHFIRDEDAIRSYNENPKTDFHQWVADTIGCDRKPAKRINFGMGYGAGKKKVTQEIANDPTIIAHIGQKVAEMVRSGQIDESEQNSVFQTLCYDHASNVYQTYHERLPGIKNMSELAAQTARTRGYVRNPYGRRRYLEPKFSRKAFNTVVQGCAMDIMKEQMVKISPRYNSESRAWGYRLAANVHDEVLGKAPRETAYDPEFWKWIRSNLESPSVKFRVPIVTGLGISPNSWAEAGDDDALVMDGDRFVAGNPELQR